MTTTDTTKLAGKTIPTFFEYLDDIAEFVTHYDSKITITCTAISKVRFQIKSIAYAGKTGDKEFKKTKHFIYSIIPIMRRPEGEWQVPRSTKLEVGKEFTIDVDYLYETIDF